MAGAGKTLVLGSTGFFGSWICHELGDRGLEVCGVSHSAGSPRADLLDPDGLRQLLATERPAAVVNAAGMTSPAAALADPAGCFRINAGGMLNLLEAIRTEAPEARPVALSSAAVYHGEPPFGEDSPTAAANPYAASKLAMELLCRQYAKGSGLPITVLRCFNLTGPGEPAGQATSEFTLAALAALPGEQVEVQVGEPGTARDFTDVRDAARAVRLVLERRLTGTFNLCSGRDRSLGELAGMISRETGVELRLRGSGGGRAASGQIRVRGEGRRLTEATGWQPEIGLQASLADLVDWRRANP